MAKGDQAICPEGHRIQGRQEKQGKMASVSVLNHTSQAWEASRAWLQVECEVSLRRYVGWAVQAGNPSDSRSLSSPALDRHLLPARCEIKCKWTWHKVNSRERSQLSGSREPGLRINSHGGQEQGDAKQDPPVVWLAGQKEKDRRGLLPIFSLEMNSNSRNI